ncbi:glycosyltransferase [Candidatus Hydrogenedentota bacterium]
MPRSHDPAGQENTVTPDYSIIVPAYNEEDYLPETLGNIRESMSVLPEYRGEIVVTDNNSTDRTAEIAEKFGARVVFEEHQQIARARNAGGREAQGKYFIFVDADTQISPALLRKTLATLDSGEYCGGGTTVKFDQDLPSWAERSVKLWIFLSKTFKWACGAYVFCTRRAFLETGGFDERYYASEEVHFSRAVRRWGRKRGQMFVILDEPISTSVRKLEWYGPWEMLYMTLRMLFGFRRLRSREACYMWYKRPGKSGTTKHAKGRE